MPKPRSMRFFLQSTQHPLVRGELPLPEGEPGVEVPAYPPAPPAMRVGDRLYRFSHFGDNRHAFYQEIEQVVEIDADTLVPA